MENAQELKFNVGYGTLPRLKFIKYLNNNVDGYLESKEWSEKQKQLFREQYRNVINGIANGTFSMNVDGTFTDTTNQLYNNNDKLDSVGRVAQFISKGILSLDDKIITPEQSVKTPDKYSNDLMKQHFKNIYFGGNEIDEDSWRNRDIKNSDGTFQNTKRALEFSNFLDNYISELNNKEYDFTGTAFKDKSDLINRLQRASDNLKNETFDNSDISDLLSAGVSASALNGYLLGKGTPNPPVQNNRQPVQQPMQQPVQQPVLSLPKTQTKSVGQRVVADLNTDNIAEAFNKMSDWDKARLAAVGADVISAISSFIPGYGTVVSGVSGIGSTLTSATADIAEGDFSWTRTGLNLGADVIGLIPGLGVPAKIAKVTRIVKPIAKTLTTLAIGMGITDAVVVLDKISNNKKITVDDLRTLGDFLKITSGLGRAGTVGRKMLKLEKNLQANGGVNKVRRLNGEVKTKQQVKDASEAFGRLNPKRYTTRYKGREKTEYDWTKLTGKDKTALETKGRFHTTRLAARSLGYKKEVTPLSTTPEPNPVETPVTETPVTPTTPVSPTPVSPTPTPTFKSNGVPSKSAALFKHEVDDAFKATKQLSKNPTYVKNAAKAELMDRIKSIVSGNPLSINGKLTKEQLKGLKQLLAEKDLTKLGNKKLKALLKSEKIIFKQGGILKAQRGIKINDGRSWYDDIFLRLKPILLNQLASGKLTPEELNTKQDEHSLIYNSAKNSGDFYNSAYNGGLPVTSYQDWYNKKGYNNYGILNGQLNGRYTIMSTTPNSGDSAFKWIPDGLFSGETDDRRILGREGDFNQELLNSFNNELSNYGLQLYLDDKTKYYKLNSSSNNSSESDNQSGNVIVPLDETEKEEKNKKIKNTINSIVSSIASPDTLSLIRYVRANQINNKIIDRALANNQSYSEKYPNGYLYIRGDLASKNAIEKAANELLSKKALSSRAQTNEAVNLEREKAAADNRIKANLAYNEGIDKSAEKATALDMEMARARLDASNRNTERALAASKYATDLENQRDYKNWENLNTLLSENEYRMRLNKERLDYYDDNLMQYELATARENNAEYTAARNAYLRIANDSNVSEAEKQEALNKVSDIGKRIDREARYTYYDKMRKKYGYTKSSYKPEYTFDRVFRKGGRVEEEKIKARTKDNELFMKGIQDIRKHGEKMMDNLSRGTLLALRKALNL